MQHSSDISCPGDLAVFVRGRCEGKRTSFYVASWWLGQGQAPVLNRPACSAPFHDLISREKLLHGLGAGSYEACSRKPLALVNARLRDPPHNKA